MVMDAAAKSDGVSLNSKLLTGPDLLNSLVGVLLRFREGKVAIGADIEAMFHQCLISDDQPAGQRPPTRCVPDARNDFWSSIVTVHSKLHPKEDSRC